MSNMTFDQYADKYDTWFLKNEAVLASEVALLAHFLKKPGRVLSVGCGSGLFEAMLKRDYGIIIAEGLEPADGMAEIARKRGMMVTIGNAESTNLGNSEFDTIVFNGSPSYITELAKAFENAYSALKTSGRIVVLDVPKESSYALLYNLGKVMKTWDHELFIGVKPQNIYPIEFVLEARWRTTEEKTKMLKDTGFKNFKYAQTLTRHPYYSNDAVEKPVSGFDRGDYVAIKAEK